VLLPPKEYEIKKKPTRKAKQLPLCFYPSFVERMTGMSTDLMEEQLLVNYVFSQLKILSQRYEFLPHARSKCK